MYANEVETKRKEKLPEKRNNYNINKNPWKYKALLKTFHLNGGIIKDCPQIESYYVSLKNKQTKTQRKTKLTLTASISPKVEKYSARVTEK